MKVLAITDTEVDLLAQDIVFHPGATVLAVNISAASETIQDSDTSGSGFGTLQASTTLTIVSLTLDKQYIKLSSAGTVYLVAN
jgi:hypothetical protein